MNAFATLADIRRSAPAGYPRGKGNLIARLAREGARKIEGPATRGQRGFLYDVVTLPQPIRDALAGEDADASPYQKATGAQKAEADQRLVLVRKVRSLIQQGRSVNAACTEASAEGGVSTSTVKALWRLVKDAPEAGWRDLLVKRYKGREKEPVPETIYAHFYREYGRPEQPAFQAAYERTAHEAERKGWGPMPSLATLIRRWKDEDPLLRAYLRDGDRGLNAEMPHAERDRSQTHPMDGWNGDYRLNDVRVRFPDGTIGRPGMYLIQDEGSNMPVAWALTRSADETESTDLICEASQAGIARYGLPGLIRFDNTRAAANKHVTGGARSRFRGKITPDEIDGAFKRLGVTVAFALPFNGRAKLVERAFGDLKERIEKDPRAAGAYVGHRPDAKPANYGENVIEWDVWVAIVTEAMEDHINRKDRRSQVAWKKSFRAVFEEGCAKRTDPVRKPSAEEIRVAFLRSERKRFVKGTVSVGKRPHANRFHCKELHAFSGKDVVVRYDPQNLAAPIIAEQLDGRTIAENVPLLGRSAFNSTKDARAWARADRREKKATKDQAKARRAKADAILGTPSSAGSATAAAAPRVVAPTRFNAQRKAEAEQNAKAQAEAERQTREDRQARLRGRQMLRGDGFEPGFSRAG